MEFDTPVVALAGAHEALRLPLFYLGTDSPPKRGVPPLAIISGSLLVDSGEAENTFVFRCQDRYLIYNHLFGLRSVIFALNDSHVRIYEALLDALHERLARVTSATGLPGVPRHDPLFVACDIDSLRLDKCASFVESLREAPVREALRSGAIYLNQVSPVCSDFLGQLRGLLLEQDLRLSISNDFVSRLGALALKYHDKAKYVELVAENSWRSLPAHVPTMILDPEDFLAIGSWRELVDLYFDETGDQAVEHLYVKSSLDSSGNVAACICAENFDERSVSMRREILRNVLSRDVDLAGETASLRGEVDLAPSLRSMGLTDEQLRHYKACQQERRMGIKLLVQRQVGDRTGFTETDHGVGISCHIRKRDSWSLIAAVTQIYADPDRLHFLGAYMSDALTRRVMSPDMTRGIGELCECFAGEGYRGPINFDARRNAAGDYELIYDCNPRLTAVYPLLAMRRYLRSAGLQVDSLLNLGYRGEFAYSDIGTVLERLRKAELLYTRWRPEGILLLPNVSRDHGYDLIAINMTPSEFRPVLESGILLEDTLAGVSAIAEGYYH